MEQEHFISGFCRVLDGSRTVTVVTENDAITDVDCCFYNCIHAAGCTVAKEIRELEKAE